MLLKSGPSRLILNGGIAQWKNARNDHGCHWPQLIGILIGLNGFTECVNCLMATRQLLSPHVPYPQYIIAYGVEGPTLGCAAIVIGIGLVSAAVWARRAAVTLVLLQFFYFGFMRILPYLNHAEMPSGMSFPYAILFVQAKYLLMCLFLAALGMKTTWEDTGQPGTLTRCAEWVMHRLPRATPLLSLFVALLFFCWAATDLRYTGRFPGRFYAICRRRAVEMYGNRC